MVPPWPEQEAVTPHPVSAEVLHAALSSWGCQASDVQEIGGRWYAACGAGGVYIVERRGASDLVLRGRRQGQGEARSLFMRGGSLWVELVQLEARPLSDLPAAVVASASQSSPGASVRAYDDEIPGQKPARAVAMAPEQEPARESTVAPGRVGGVLRLEGALRPFLPIARLGFASLLELVATYHGERAWYVEARAFPLGGLVGRGRNASLLGLSASAGYDHAYFAVGLGVGLLRHGEGNYYNNAGFGGDGFSDSWQVADDEIGFLISQAARLGALDGLHLRIHNAFVLDDERWRFGYVDVSLQIPLNSRTWLVAGGGGGQQAAFFMSEVGLRRLLFGTRGSGSMFLRPSVGVAGVDTRIGAVSIGPMVGLHVEYRP